MPANGRWDFNSALKGLKLETTTITSLHLIFKKMTSSCVNVGGVTLRHVTRDIHTYIYLFVFGATAPQWARTSSFTRFLNHTQRRTTDDRILLDERSVRRRDFNLTTHNTHGKQPCLLWDSHPQSQQDSGRRPMPQTSRSMGSAHPYVNVASRCFCKSNCSVC